MRKLLKETVALTLILLICGFAAAATENYWLDKPEWTDRPSYAENFTIQYQATDLIQKREAREVCTKYNETSSSIECLNYENQTVAGQGVSIFNMPQEIQHRVSGPPTWAGHGCARTV